MKTTIWIVAILFISSSAFGQSAQTIFNQKDTVQFAEIRTTALEGFEYGCYVEVKYFSTNEMEKQVRMQYFDELEVDSLQKKMTNLPYSIALKRQNIIEIKGGPRNGYYVLRKKCDTILGRRHVTCIDGNVWINNFPDFRKWGTVHLDSRSNNNSLDIIELGETNCCLSAFQNYSKYLRPIQSGLKFDQEDLKYASDYVGIDERIDLMRKYGNKWFEKYSFEKKGKDILMTDYSRNNNHPLEFSVYKKVTFSTPQKYLFARLEKGKYYSSSGKKYVTLNRKECKRLLNPKGVEKDAIETFTQYLEDSIVWIEGEKIPCHLLERWTVSYRNITSNSTLNRIPRHYNFLKEYLLIEQSSLIPIVVKSYCYFGTPLNTFNQNYKDENGKVNLLNSDNYVLRESSEIFPLRKK